MPGHGAEWILRILLAWTLLPSMPAQSGGSTASNGAPIASSPSAAIFNVTRVFNNGDVFSNTDPKCDPKMCVVWGASVVRSSPCHCQCPSSKPAFLQHIRQCSNQIDECKLLQFNHSGTLQRIPTLFLPLSGQSIASASPINWAENVRLEANGSTPCSVSGGGYLTQNGWMAMDSEGIFSLHTIENQTFVQWHGTKHDQLLLTGKVVQVTFRCTPQLDAVDFCLVFRVIGKDGPLDSTVSSPQWGASSMGGNGGGSERANQLGLIVGIVCGALLAVTLVSVAVFWTVCWKQQKERLARKIQLHVLYQQQRMHQQAASGAFPHLANAFPAVNEPAVSSTIEMLQNYGNVVYSPYLEANSHLGQQQAQQCWIDPQSRQNEEMARRYLMEQHHQQRGGLLAMDHHRSSLGPGGEQLILPPPPPYPHARKKLYFSPEFFDPRLMSDPPPVAEEFLYEVRRMIDLAKNRIRSRRYIPSLLGIPEEGGGHRMQPHDHDHHLGGYSTRSMNLERRDSFSKMAQEPAPQETLTIRELDEEECEREHAESPRSSSTSAESPGDSSAGRASTSGGGGDTSGGRVSVDSGLGEEKPSDSVQGPHHHQTDKVSHWLSRLPPSLDVEEDEAPSSRQHSKLYAYFNARQHQRALNADGNVIRVCVNEDHPHDAELAQAGPPQTDRRHHPYASASPPSHTIYYGHRV